jgi:hypothetical protein
MVLWTAAAILVLNPFSATAGTLLGTAQSFAILAASTITNTGPSTISGSVGLYPGTSITGLLPVQVTNGIIHTTDAVAQQAQLDQTYAYQTLAGLGVGVDESGVDLGGLTLTPGIYSFSSSAALNGVLTLDFQGNANALFIFRIGSALTTGSGSSVVVVNGLQTDGIYWQVGSSATLGTSTTFAGNILALTSITLDTTAKIECGRAFAQTGAVTLDTNSISNNCSVNDLGSSRSDFGSSGFSSSGDVALVTPEPATFFGLCAGLAIFVSKQRPWAR